MKISLQSKRQGIALIIVMIMVTTLSAMALYFGYSMKVETRLARNANSETQLIWLGRSGVELAKCFLANTSRAEPYDSLNQKWAGGPGGASETNGALENLSLTDNEFAGGAFSVKITDLERKFNINIANEDILQQAMTLMGVSASDMPVIIDSILDWIDPDDDTHINGTESDYYMSLPPPQGPYECKNGPIDDLSELQHVRGITPAIYWGPSYASHQTAWFQEPVDKFGRAMDVPTNSVGLVDLFTPISAGKLNINTASATALQLLGIDEPTANLIIQQRAGPDGVDGTDDDVPFRNPGELATVGISQTAYNVIQNKISVRSATFDVEVDARVGDYHKIFHAIVVRTSPTDLQTLSFYWK